MDNSSDFFELMLRKISIQAFDALLTLGIRDVAGLVLMTEKTLHQSGIPTHIAIELLKIKQEGLKRTENSCQNDNNRSETCLPIDETLNKVPQSEKEWDRDSLTPIPPNLVERLSTRAQNLIAREKILTCEQLMELSEQDLFDFANIGKKTVHELKNLQIKLEKIIPAIQNELGKVCVQSDDFQPESLASPRSMSSAHKPGSNRYFQSWPPDWSLLSRTLPELFQISMTRFHISIFDEYTTIDNLGLSPCDIDRLTKMMIFPEDPAEDLLVMSVGYLLQSGIGDEALASILSYLRSISGGTDSAQLTNPSITLSNIAIYSDVPLDLIADQLITDFCFPDILPENKCTSSSVAWGDLAFFSERDIFERLGFTIRGLKAIQYLWDLRDKAIKKHILFSKGLPAEAYRSFENLVDTFISTIGKKRRDFRVLKGRLGLFDGQVLTLEELGVQEHVSRERIRQIEKQLLPILQKPHVQERLCRLWMTIEEILTSGGGANCASEINESLTTRWKWPSAPSSEALASLLGLSPNYKVVWGSPVYIVQPRHKCICCAAIKPVLVKEVENQIDGTLPFENAAIIIRDYCHNHACVDAPQVRNFSKGFFHFLDSEIEELVADETSLYTQYAWAQKYGKQGAGLLLVETILHNAGRPMHFREVHAEVNKDRPSYRKLLERNIYAYIERSAELFLWGPGTFIHKDYIIIPDSIIAEIEKDILSRLKKQIPPFLLVTGIFDKNKNILAQAGIPNAQALYSCLRLKDNHELDCYDYPYIKIRGNNEQHIPILLLLETFIKEQEDVVTLATIPGRSGNAGIA